MVCRSPSTPILDQFIAIFLLKPPILGDLYAIFPLKLAVGLGPPLLRPRARSALRAHRHRVKDSKAKRNGQTTSKNIEKNVEKRQKMMKNGPKATAK